MIQDNRSVWKSISLNMSIWIFSVAVLVWLVDVLDVILRASVRFSALGPVIASRGKKNVPSQAVSVSFQTLAIVHSMVFTLIISGNLCPLKQPNVIREPYVPGVPLVEFRVAFATVAGTVQAAQPR